MKRIYQLLLVLMLTLPLAHGAVVNGTVVTARGTRFNGKVCFTLAQGYQTSGAALVPGPAVCYDVANGKLPSSASVVANTLINPTGTYYTVEFKDAYGKTLETRKYRVDSDPWDIGFSVPLQVSGNVVVQITGPTGPAGAVGAVGAMGPSGAAATIAVGAVTTLPTTSPATVTNVGSSSAAVFNFGIPKGPDGTTWPLLAPIDNTYDIGGSSSTFRPRTGYFGTAVVSPAFRLATFLGSKCVHTDGSGNLVEAAGDCGSGGGDVVLANANVFTNTNTFRSILFGANNTYDIGDSGNTARPRNVYANTSVVSTWYTDGTQGMGINMLNTFVAFGQKGSYWNVAIPLGQNTGPVKMGSAITLGWSPDGNLGNPDTAFSRTGAGVVAIGNGTQGNASGTLNAAAYQVGGTSFAAANLSDGTQLKKRSIAFLVGSDGAASALALTDSQDAIWYNQTGVTVTIQSIACVTNAGSVTFQIYQGASWNYNTTNPVMNAATVCSAGGGTINTWTGTNNIVLSGAAVHFRLTVVDGTAKRLSVFIQYTL